MDPPAASDEKKTSQTLDDQDADFKPDSAELTPPPESAMTPDQVEEDLRLESDHTVEDDDEPEDQGAEANDEFTSAIKEAASLPADFVEWEAVRD